jgi:hypothetical protein
MLLSSTPKIVVASQFPFSSAHQAASYLSFAVHDSLRFLVSLFHNSDTQHIGINASHALTTTA